VKKVISIKEKVQKRRQKVEEIGSGGLRRLTQIYTIFALHPELFCSAS
jgi:hypothetical protein